MILLRKYIRKVLNETINYKDSQNIEKTIQTFKQNLKSKGLDLDNLEFDAGDISHIRDSRIPRSADLLSTNLFFGVGFNPFGEMDKLNNLNILKDYRDYIERLNYSTRSNRKIDIFHKIVDGAFAINSAAKQSGLNILGAGIFRVALQIPSIPNVIIKIALSESGRDDNLNEVNFSLGQSAATVTHKENFSNVYSYSKNGSWMIVDKEVMFIDLLDGFSPDIMNNLIENQFKKTMHEFDELKLPDLHWSGKKPDILSEYLQHMFDFDDKGIKSIRKSFAKKDHADTFTQSLVFRVKTALGIKGEIKSSNYIKMSDEYFKNQFCNFLVSVISDSSSMSSKKKKEVAEVLVNEIEKKAEKTGDLFRELFKDFGMLYDQAMTTGIRDMHLGNLGVKKGQDGNYRIIFTDIDAGTYD
tara:strand:- start:1917 stop:3155 length:1239 start_codon:yes stop_codon:yes gene_type:complete